MAETNNDFMERSKAITKEHCSLRRDAGKTYREAGLFSIRNLIKYMRALMELDRAYTTKHVEEWQKFALEARRANLRQWVIEEYGNIID